MKKKTNIIKRNSGFLAGCVLAAGASFFAADTIMSNGLPMLTEETTATVAQTKETVAAESTDTKTYETDPFTVTASGNIIKGVETEDTKETGKKTTTAETDEDGNEIQTTAETDENGAVIGETTETDENGQPVQETLTLDENGNIISSDGTTDPSGSDQTYKPSDDSGNYVPDDASDGYQPDYYENPIEIYDTDNGDYYVNPDYQEQTGTVDTTPAVDDRVYTDFWSDSVMPDTNCRYIDESDLYGYSTWELKLIRNEIFARHGRIFTSSDLAEYFSQKSWYVPKYSPEEFDANMDAYLTDYEIANLEVIIQYEDKVAGY